MYATVRRYKNAAALANAMSSRSDEVKKLITGVPGFVNYFATRKTTGAVATSMSALQVRIRFINSPQ